MDQDSNSAGRPSPRVLISSVKVILPRVRLNSGTKKNKLKGRKKRKEKNKKTTGLRVSDANNGRKRKLKDLYRTWITDLQERLI
jgi:hypothetical protein